MTPFGFRRDPAFRFTPDAQLPLFSDNTGLPGDPGDSQAGGAAAEAAWRWGNQMGAQGNDKQFRWMNDQQVADTGWDPNAYNATNPYSNSQDAQMELVRRSLQHEGMGRRPSALLQQLQQIGGGGGY